MKHIILIALFLAALSGSAQTTAGLYHVVISKKGVLQLKDTTKVKRADSVYKVWRYYY